MLIDVPRPEHGLKLKRHTQLDEPIPPILGKQRLSDCLVECVQLAPTVVILNGRFKCIVNYVQKVNKQHNVGLPKKKLSNRVKVDAMRSRF